MSDSLFANLNGSLPTAAESTEQPFTRLDELRAMVKEFEEFDELVSLRMFGHWIDRDGRTLNKKERIQREHRYRLLEYQLFGSDDWCAPGVVDRELDDLRDDVNKLGDEAKELGLDCDEVKELLRRIDAVAENMSDE